jgi:hypothetical protein
MLNKRDELLLGKIYNDVANPGSFSSAARLYGRAKKQSKLFKATLADVTKYLELIDPYTLHRRVVKRFKRRKIISKHIDYIWESDLIVLPSIAKENKNNKYIMTCIDVLSRQAFAMPLKTKSGPDVAAGLRKIFTKFGRSPSKINTDGGKEYFNRHVKALFKKYNIIHYSTTSDAKCAIVERFQRTLMTKMHKYFTSANTLTYIDILDSLMDSYNNRHHRTLNMAPIDVTTINEKQVFNHLYKGSLSSKKRVFKYKIGDLVRVSKNKRLFTKGYLQNFTQEYFKVVDTIASVPITYRLSDLQGDVIRGIFYQAELQRIRLEGPDKLFKIEIIKTRQRKKVKEYLVHYVGWPKTFDEWVGGKHKLLTCQ